MEFCSPESKGISSKNILAFIKRMEEARLSSHDLLIMRGGKMVYEAYWEPFDKEFLHRMYSVTKSFTAIAVGFLEQDGLICLDDKISKYFPEESKDQKDENMQNLTLRNMLMMSTCKTEDFWFDARCADRVKYYFENISETRTPGTTYNYDSPGSFVLAALVERLSGKPIMDYLREKLFDKIGVSKEVDCLKCPGGHSWGDSALLCTPRDLALVAQFMMQKGKWNGEQILNEEFATTAVSKLVDNSEMNDNEFDRQGYGYLIWRTWDNSFFFNGMGCQFAICVPDKDIVVVYNADNQGKLYAKNLFFQYLFDLVIRPAKEEALEEDPEAQQELKEYTQNLTLACAQGEAASPMMEQIQGKTYIMGKNKMGITKLKFTFDADAKHGVLSYTNAQGDKEIPFGIGENVYAPFPQDGYSDRVGSQPGERRYRCAASAAWTMPDTLMLKVQIIDTYFGLLHMRFGFHDDKVGVIMMKTAEDFLAEYEGHAGGQQER